MPTQIKSLSKGLKIYKYIVDYGKPIQARTLCEKLQIDKSTMSRLLRTLEDEGFISYLENSREIIANDIAIKTNQATRIELLIQKTKILLEEISQKTDETAYLGIFDEYKLLYLNQIDTTNRKLTTRSKIGVQTQLYTNALGKSILAFGNYNLEQLKLNQYTNNTITDIKNLDTQLNLVRDKGFSIDNKEYQDGMCCVGVPLFNTDNILIGAVGISGSSTRLDSKKLDSIGKKISNLVETYKIIY
ncbi:IclR family transcriptional regulator [Poseidonibacter antarcticus]|uniref:IclR family transcriptional regulator n=1 Tax=Poseidonibacter antarcticus TaxID=2478538 RepID=UPI000EF4E227|nr:IclR family transcriptional regulator [Poseidonibacter antarcticus]